MDKKKLYFQLSDGADVSKVTMEISGVMAWIESDIEMDEKEGDEIKSYLLEPVYLTETEFENLPEADL